MSKIFFTITRSEEFTGATILIDGQPYPVSSDHPNYEEVTDILLNSDAPDAEYLISLVKPLQTVSDALIRLSERVTIGGNVLYFDGDPIDGALSDHIIRIYQDSEGRDEGYLNFVAFLEKLATNPSKKSKRHLYDFVEHHGLTINEEGDLVLWKSTRADGKSTYAGHGIVTDNEGKITTYTKDYLPNAVGYVVEIPRELVDDDRNAACSTGLHVGAFGYASTYSQRLFNVVVNPRDVVSVPHDASSAKIRVARYRVIGENTEKTNYEGHSIKTEDAAKLGSPAEVDIKSLLTGDPEQHDAVAITPPVGAGSRVAEYEALIKAGGAGANLRRYRNKSVTSGRRAEFDQAVANLGLQYS